MSFGKTVTGFAFAVVAPAALNAALLVAYMVINSFSNHVITGLDGALAAFGLIAVATGLVISFVGCAIFGIPIYLLLRRYELHSWKIYVFLGLLTGLLLGTPMLFVTAHGAIPDLRALFSHGWFVFFAVGGISAALTFWWIVRPDQQPVGMLV